ncbi:MAG: AraC family transcriptional regulator [Dorea sp.]|jgi:AraC-like DNA-binding protein/mannose-6-phosphate isomerase-like protein (cupin superfamily)|nr:AraC family transcriptional regulator [Dorea sp.]MCI9452811.1 AraC family transcriptional regulator [Dorea sp.]
MVYSHEIILPNDDIPFKMFIFEGKDGNYVRKKHWHRSIEIFALFEGELEFYVDEARYSLRPGEFMLVNSNEIHSIFSPKRNQTVVLQIPLTTFEKYYTDEKFIYFSHSSRLQDEEVMHLLRDMYHTYHEKPCGYELKVQGQFYMLLYILVTKYRETDVNEKVIQNSRKLDRLSQITAYMEENYREDISLESLAEIFGYSATYLSRMFRKYAKTNYKACLDDIRLEHAVKDLADTRLPIGEVVLRNGFPNSRAFVKVFKKRYGMLPKEYRRMMQPFS